MSYFLKILIDRMFTTIYNFINNYNIIINNAFNYNSDIISIIFYFQIKIYELSND
jgi:hypothetical protein